MSATAGRVGFSFAGALIGAPFGLAGVGFAIGSIVGALVFPGPDKETFGPRLDESNLGATGFGHEIPEVVGSDRVGGSYVWHGGIREVAETEDVGGKGGPSTTHTTFRYFADFQVIFAKGPVTGIRRIWARGGKLIYDASSSNTGAISKYFENIKLFLGEESQQPDPHLISKVGAANAPAYRGLAGATFVNLPLEDFGNSTPVPIEAEIVNTSAACVSTVLNEEDGPSDSGDFSFTHDHFFMWHLNSDRSLTLSDRRGGIMLQNVWDGSVLGLVDMDPTTNDRGLSIGWGGVDHFNNLWVCDPLGDPATETYKLTRYDFEGLAPLLAPLTIESTDNSAVVADNESTQVTVGTYTNSLGEFKTRAIYVVRKNITAGYEELHIFRWLNTTAFNTAIIDLTSFGSEGTILGGISDPHNKHTDSLGRLYTSIRTTTTTGPPKKSQYDLVLFDVFGEVQRHFLYDETSDTGDTIFKDLIAAGGSIFSVDVYGFDSTTNSVILFILASGGGGNIIARWSVDDEEIVENYQQSSGTTDEDNPALMDEGHPAALLDNGFMWLRVDVDSSASDSTFAFALFDTNTLTLQRVEDLSDCTEPSISGTTEGKSIRLYDRLTNGFISHGGTDNDTATFRGYTKYLIDRVGDGSDVTLKTVVDTFLDQARDTSLPRDTSAFSSTTLTGYTRTRRAPVRGVLEPPLRTFAADLIESDWQLKGVMRGGSSVVTIPEDQLGAKEQGQDTSVRMSETRLQDLELPRRLDLVYKSKKRDYDTNIQHAKFPKEVVTTEEQRTVNTPVVIDDDTAKQTVRRMIDLLYVSRNQFATTLTPKYRKLDPGDVITAQKDDEDFCMMITDVRQMPSGVIDIEAVGDDSGVFTQEETGTAADDSQVFTGEDALPGPTRLYLMDIPMLRDIDDDPGFYVAVAGYLTSWNGAIVFVSIDGGEFEELLTFSESMEATAGFTTTALADTSDVYTIDDVNTVTVKLLNSDMTLADKTRIEVLGGSNIALIGDEVVGFEDVTDNGDGTWTLARLRRAERGTEAETGTHAVGDRFVLLEERSVRRTPMDLDVVDTERVYKAVSIGAFDEDSPGISFTNTAKGLHPYSVVHIDATNNGGGDKVITWFRRTRVGGGWNDGTDVPLGEDSESYEIDILDGPGGTVLRTLTSSSETVTYTVAQYNSDFGAAVSEVPVIDVAIYQMSADVGRGFKATAQV